MSRSFVAMLLIVLVCVAGCPTESSAEQSDQRGWAINHNRGLLDEYDYRNGDHLYIYMSLWNHTSAFYADIYIGIIDTFGRVWTLDWDAWKQGNYAYYKNPLIPADFYYQPTFVNEIVFPIRSPVPLGTYWLAIAVVEEGKTMTQDDVSYQVFYLVE